ncbi:hypothetical protein CSC17_5139 [Klebsiella oxytoca]|nr:hypothetical protein CSC17_5139 [Klebsiella oxytoca]
MFSKVIYCHFHKYFCLIIRNSHHTRQYVFTFHLNPSLFNKLF